MSAPTTYQDNLDGSPLKYAPKWIREQTEPRREVSESEWVDFSPTDTNKETELLKRCLDEVVGSIAEERRLLSVRTQRRVPIGSLRPNPQNPRQTHTDEELDELTESIRTHGIIQPIAVRAVLGATETYEIVAGERRWRAAQRAQLNDIPIVLLDVSDSEALEIAIIENVQRADLNPLEEAAGYQALTEKYGHSQEAIAKTVGKSRSYIANTLRLLKLPDEVKGYIHTCKLTAGHARSLVAQPDAQKIAEQIISQRLTVRQVEALAQKRAIGVGDAAKASTRLERGTETLALEKRLSDLFGLPVKIGRRHNGVLNIRYKSFDQLEEILRRLEKALWPAPGSDDMRLSESSLPVELHRP